MPRGVPRLGSHAGSLTEVPQAQFVGTVDPEKVLAPEKTNMFVSSSGANIDMTEPPPPWETSPGGVRDNTDARSFVRVPDNWVLRWVNPKHVDVVGWRYWEPVSPSDSRVQVLNKQLIHVDNTIRRGGRGGSILAWMYRGWYESRLQQKAQDVARKTTSAVDRAQAINEEFQRQSYGPYVSGRVLAHPTHTIADGRSMKEDK